MLLKFETEAKSLRPRTKGPKAKAEARGYEAEAKFWRRGEFGLEALKGKGKGSV